MWGVCYVVFLMIRRPPRSTQSSSSAASDVYKRQAVGQALEQFLTLFSNGDINSVDFQVEGDKSDSDRPKGNGFALCPDCGNTIEHLEGCLICPSCGWSKC